MSSAERLRFSANHPDNFINAMRTIEDLPDDLNLSTHELLSENLSFLKNVLRSDSYTYQPTPCFYVYQLKKNDFSQTGIVAEVSMVDYQKGAIKGHESTRSDHEGHIYEYLKVVGAVSSPICAAHRSTPDIEAIVQESILQPSLLSFDDDDQVRQTIWAIRDSKKQSKLQELFLKVPKIYLTDGHHRVAAGVRYSVDQRFYQAHDNPWDYFLMALFPIDEMRIMPFNRCVRDTHGLSFDKLMKRLSKAFVVKKLHRSDCDFFGPRRRGEFVLFFQENFYQLNILPHLVPDDPVTSLDVSLLQDYVLGPILGIENPRTDQRLDYVVGNKGLDGLVARCQAGWELGFACYPPSFDELVAVADASMQMPPKSTCFDPKARSGVFVRLFNQL
tara:strand:+ start:41179 stop:42342 length:1164 start_codon:yes stop_codon:yes gene_type:complete